MGSMKAALVWIALGAAIAAPVVVAATSPLLEWREPVYVAAGLAGIAALALMLVQPLLAAGFLPGLPARRGRLVHRFVGVALLVAVLLHVAGLWITSPPDVVDALTFTSPTPFSAWGVIAMWGVLAAALLAALRRRIGPRVFRVGHSGIVVVVVATSVLHALLIDGTMGTTSKIVLCLLVLGATATAVAELRAWRMIPRRRA